MSETVTVELSREDAEHLFGRCTESTNAPKINGYSCEQCRVIGTQLRTALDSPSGGTGVEYRVVGDRDLPGDWEGAPTGNKETAEREARELAQTNDKVRIQQSTVTRTQWEDMPNE